MVMVRTEESSPRKRGRRRRRPTLVLGSGRSHPRIPISRTTARASVNWLPSIRKPRVAMAQPVATTKQRPPLRHPHSANPSPSCGCSHVFNHPLLRPDLRNTAFQRGARKYPVLFSSRFCLHASANCILHALDAASVPGTVHAGKQVVSTNCCTCEVPYSPGVCSAVLSMHQQAPTQRKAPLSQSQPLDCSKYSSRVILVAPPQAHPVLRIPFCTLQPHGCRWSIQQSHIVLT